MYLTFKNQHFPLKLLLIVHKMTTLTFICQVGMKSALCRTLSKIFCSWGLMKELSEKRKRSCDCEDIRTLFCCLCCCDSVYLECWASVLSWGQPHEPCRACWLFSQHWPLTEEENLTGHSCLQNRQHNMISSDTKRTALIFKLLQVNN